MKATVKVKVELYRGIYICEGGEVGTSTYDTTEGSKEHLKEMFKNDCEKNKAKFVKFFKVSTEKRLYTIDIVGGDYEVIE